MPLRPFIGKKAECMCCRAPFLTPISPGLTYLTERFKGFQHGGNVLLQEAPRSILAAFAEEYLLCK